MSDIRQDPSIILKNKNKRRKLELMRQDMIKKADYLQANYGGSVRIEGENLRYSTDGQRQTLIFKEGPNWRIEDSGAKPPDLAALFEQARNTTASKSTSDHPPGTIKIPQNECSVSTDALPASSSKARQSAGRIKEDRAKASKVPVAHMGGGDFLQNNGVVPAASDKPADNDSDHMVQNALNKRKQS
ncbi:uncharacterized protein PG998_014366 [Apiospora kogelbergensis]|uniref:Uncharacterized protein n=1 Tax=Apiospora kogelbergensis TaxID=1337665 RepID=A0AAW0QM78_9PEZI